MSFTKKTYDEAMKGIPELIFNNTYDPELVENYTRYLRNSLYTFCLEGQRRSCRLNIIAGKMHEFNKNNYLAKIFNLPESTYFTRIENKFLHFFSEKNTLYLPLFKEDPIQYPDINNGVKNTPFIPYFTDITFKQGCLYTKYDLYDVCKSNKIFKSRLLFFLRESNTTLKAVLYMNLIIIPTKTSTYLAIRTEGENSIPEQFIKSLIDKQSDWFLYESKAGNIWINNSYNSSNFISEGNDVYIQHIFPDTKIPLGSPYLTSGANAYLVCFPSENGWKFINASYCKTTSNKYGYRVPKSFVNGITGTTKLLIMNEKQLHTVISFPGTLHSTNRNSSPKGIFQIELQDNPIPPDNILYFIKDNEDGSLFPLPNAKTTLWFPNVYKVSYDPVDLESSDIIAFVYYDNNIDTKFINPIKNYMEYRGIQYINDCIYQSHPEPLQRYIPYKFDFSINDYHNDSLYIQDKPYQYILNKEIWMLLDDPNRYNFLFSNIISKLTKHNNYFYEKMVVDIGLLNRRVRNNHKEITNESKWRDFEEDMTFIRINTRTDEILPVWVFIDEYRIPYTFNYTEGFTQYIYFPFSVLKADSIITIEIFDIRSTDLKSATLRFQKTFKEIPFPENFDHFSDQNLIFYNSSDKKIIPNSDFHYGIYTTIEKDYFLTNSSEKIKTVDNEYFILGSRIKLVSDNNFYKNIGTRVSKQVINFVGTPIYTTIYRNNHEKIHNPSIQKEWDEDMLCIEIESETAYYPLTLIIDDKEVIYSDIYRYFEFDLNKKNTVQYIFFPKKYTTSTSVAVITTLIAQNWEFLKNKVSFTNTGEICIYTSNENNINKDITVQSCDMYQQFYFNKNEKVLNINNFIFDIDQNRFRFWKFNENTKKAIMLNNDLFKITFPSLYKGNVIIEHSITNLENELIFVEYMPFKYRCIEVYDNPGGIKNTDIIDMYNKAERPVDKANYEIYMNGLLMPSNFYRNITPTKIKFKNDYSTAKIYLVEKEHDQDVHGNIYRKMTLEEQLMEYDESFKNWMFENA